MIVVEESLLINFFVCFSILKLVGAILREKVRLCWLSSICGAIVCLACPAFELGGLRYLVLVCLISLLTLTSFEYKSFKNFLLRWVLISLSTFCLGGGCLALENAVGRFPLFIVAVLGVSGYALCCIVLKCIRRANNIKKFTYKLILKDGDRVVEEEGYLDSGNVLYDNISNKPIILVTFDVFKKFYENVDYLNARLQKVNQSSIKNAHYIKINGIGKGTSMLVFTVDELTVEDRYYQNVSLGLSFSGFEKSFGKNILLHCDYV